jgi:hypothetical protein
MATIFQTISTLSGIVTDAITAGADTNVPAKLVRNTLVKVSTGKYYEVLPIIVPAECCIIGDELRSTNVQARTSTNSSLTPAKDFTYSYQALDRVKSVVDDIVTGVAVTPTTGNTLTQDQTWPYAETSVVGPAVEKLARTIKRKSDSSLGNKLEGNLPRHFESGVVDVNDARARDLIFINKEFLQNETIAYITTNYPNLKYSKTKCKQDVGFIIDAIRYDLTYGGNYQSVIAGDSYYNGRTGTLQIPQAQKTAIIAAYGNLKALMQTAGRNIVVNPVSQTPATVGDVSTVPFPQRAGIGGDADSATRIGNLMDNITSIINNGIDTVTTTFPSLSNVDGALTSASELLETGLSTIKEQTIDFISKNFGSFKYDSAKCRRDLRKIITDTSYDVALGTNFNAVYNGIAYQRPMSYTVLNSQLTQTVGAIRYARDQLKISVTTDGSSASGSSNASDRIDTAYDEVVDIIRNGTLKTAAPGDGVANALSFPDPGSVVQNRKDAKDNLVANRTFIVEDVIAYINNTYSFTYDADLYRANIGYFVDALTYDILYQGTQASTRNVDVYFLDNAVYSLYADKTTELIAAYNHLKTVVRAVVLENGSYTKQSGNAQTQQTLSTPATTTEADELDTKIDITRNALTAGNTNSVPAITFPVITNEGAEYQTAHSNIASDREDVIVDTIQFINTTYNDFKYDQFKCQRDIGKIALAARYDWMLGTNFASIVAAYSYLRQPSQKILGNQKTATIAANEFARKLAIQNVGGNATAIAGINDTWQWVEDVIWSGAPEGGNDAVADVEVYNAIRQLELNKEFIVEEALNYVDGYFKKLVTSTDPATNTLSIASTDWMEVGMPIKFENPDDSTDAVTDAGLLTTTTYYVQDIKSSTAFTIATSQYTASGGGSDTVINDYSEGYFVKKEYEYNRLLCARDIREYIDAIKYDLTWPQMWKRSYTDNITIYLPASYRTQLASRYYVNSIIGSQEEDMYYLRNGTGLRLQTLDGLRGDLGPANAYGTSRPTAGAYASLDPGWGPDDQRVWITARSPYVQNLTTFGFAATGQRIDGSLHNGGNDSIVSNDFTQVISDGIGAHILNNGRAELVSVFTYYSHIGYLAESGGRVRATNGNNSYGAFGSVAEGVDPEETAVTAVVDNRTQYNATISNVFTDTNLIQQVEYSHAGNEYTEAKIDIFGAGTGETLVADEFRDQALFEGRIIEVDDSTGNPDATAGGSGYLIVTNTAQAGTTSQVTLAATDGNSSTAYPGMKIYITGGAGAGNFGIINTYNSGSKLATIIKETDGTAGFDHTIPGTTIVAPNSTSTYLIEPRISFTSPTKANTQGTTLTSDTWNALHYMETSAEYTGVATTSQGDGTGATFDVTRNGSKYYLTLNAAGQDYTRLDTLTIVGTSVGGATPTNDITVTLSTVNSTTGAAVDFDFAGIGRKGSFIALPDAGTAAESSADGTNFDTSVTLATNATAWTNITSELIDDGSTTFNPSTAMAVGYGGTNNLLVNYSADGVSWTANSPTPAITVSAVASVAVGQVTASITRFIVIGDNDRDVAYSDNGGQTWTITSNALPTTGYTALTYGKGRFVAVKNGSQEMSYSTDGITWTQEATGMPSTGGWSDVVWGNGRFVAITDDTNGIAYSLDGQNWTAVAGALPGAGTTVGKKIAYGQGQFVVTTDDPNQVAYSEDGVYWPSGGYTLSNTYTGGLNAVAFGNPQQTPKFVAIGAGATTEHVDMRIGVTARARVGVANEQIFEVRITEPGHGYTSAPTETVVDPNNINDVLITPRIGNGVLGNPTFVARGSGFITATASIDAQNSNGVADFFQDGSFVAVKRLTSRPVNGSNVVFDSLPGQFFKLVNTVTFLGTNDGSYTAFLQLSPNMEIEDTPVDGDNVTLRIRFSQVRLTGHDFLDIGTGNFADTNYPGVPVNDPDQTKETNDADGGRVFFTATDQDGNFRVGGLFSVEQATGVATLNAEAFNIAGLQELSLGEVTLGGNSASITEFSTDPFFTANSDTVVPTQRAIKAYIESQIGGGGATLNVNSVTAGDIFIGTNTITTVSGEQINIKANVNFSGTVLGLPLAYNYFLR